MKRILIFISVIIALTGCQEDIWDCDGKTSKSAMEVMASADYWLEVRTHNYTEPNGGGDEYVSYTPDKGVIGHSLKKLAIKNDKLIMYITNFVDHPWYVDFSMEDIGGVYSITRESMDYSWKILSYDENNLKIETDCYSTTHYEKRYPYARIHFQRQVAKDPNWADKYISYEEMLERREDRLNN